MVVTLLWKGGKGSGHWWAISESASLGTPCAGAMSLVLRQGAAVLSPCHGWTLMLRETQ